MIRLIKFQFNAYELNFIQQLKVFKDSSMKTYVQLSG